MLEVIQGVKEEILQIRAEEQLVLQEIEALTSEEYARGAAEILDSAKHGYGFNGYLIRLKNLRTVLAAGVPEDFALDSVQVTWDAEIILNFWRTKENE